MLKNVVLLLCLAGIAAGQAKSAAAKPAAPAPPASAAIPTEEAVDAFMKQMVGYSGDVTWKVADIRPTGIGGLTEVHVVISDPQGSNTNRFYVTSDGKHAVTGDIIPFGAKPFDEARAKLEKGVTGPSRGPAKAAVTIVEFSDMQCPHCKQEAPIVEKLLADVPNVHFVFQNFPLPGHDWAGKAAGYIDCIGRTSKDAVWPFIQKTFEQQEAITAANADDKLKAIATESGADAGQAAACATKPETIARIEASLALGKAVGVTGTPALFINGRMLSGGIPAEVLKQIVDFQTAPEAGK